MPKIKTLPSLMALLCISILPACSLDGQQSVSQSPSPSPESSASPSSSPVALDVQLFTSEALLNQGGGGCGMSLWKREDAERPAGYLFFNRLAQQPERELTLIKINGEFVHFRRTAASGEAFYGQQTSQTFVSEDGSTTLQVDVALGEPGEIESVAVEGTMRLQKGEQTIEIPVRGDAGC